MINRNDPCWCGSNKKWKKCHYPQKSPVSLADEYRKKYKILLKNEHQIQGIKEACQFAKRVVNRLVEEAKEGVTTSYLEKLCRKMHEDNDAIPAALHYGSPPYPKSACFSLNEVICHGIADERPLVEGDIMNIDVASILGGYFGDLSKMVAIGTISEEKQRVLDCAEASLEKAISVLRPGGLLSDIGKAISEEAKQRNCSVVDEFVGHGVGLRFHEPPPIYHFSNDLNVPLVEGMVFTIEPMINAGERKSVIDPHDGWTARTIDGKPSAQVEHTVLITKSGCEVLTA